MDNSKLLVSSTPHIRSKDTTQNVMRDVIIALTPAALMGIYFFGIKALILFVVSIISCVFFEFAFQKITKQKVTIGDLSAVVTALLLAMNLPVAVPIWIPIVGGFFAIVVAKQLFGGLGQNFINPALAARAFLLASYPTDMTNFTNPAPILSGIDAISSATPLKAVKDMGFAMPQGNDFLNAAVGNISGCIGETCAIALIIGGIYLLVKKVISWRIPAVYIVSVFVVTVVFRILKGTDAEFSVIVMSAFYELFLGGIMLGAFFMATDYSSSPVTPKGQIIMGIGCGLITALIRVFGGYPEGVSYSILLMNLAVPLIDRYTKPKVFGGVKKNG